MRLHLPSFMNALRRFLPFEVNYYRHKYTLFLVPVEGHLSTSVIQDVIADSVIFSVKHLEGALTPSEQKTLFETPFESHLAALKTALHETASYVRRYVREREQTDTGERNYYEYQVNLWTVHEILVNVRTRQDALLIQQHIGYFDAVSLRMMRGYLLRFTGYDFSQRRLTEALNLLEQQGHVKQTKQTRHTVGREVVHKRTLKKIIAERRGV